MGVDKVPSVPRWTAVVVVAASLCLPVGRLSAQPTAAVEPPTDLASNLDDLLDDVPGDGAGNVSTGDQVPRTLGRPAPHRRVLGRKASPVEPEALPNRVIVARTEPSGVVVEPAEASKEHGEETREPELSDFTFRSPVAQPRVTSNFGMRRDPKRRKRRRMHKGIDYGAKRGTPVYATGPAKVLFAGRGRRGVGICVILRHDDAWVSRYFHLSKVEVKSGQYVQAGDLIGRVGNTGRSTGPHLHFEIRKKGHPIDPAKLIGTKVSSH